MLLDVQVIKSISEKNTQASYSGSITIHTSISRRNLKTHLLNLFLRLDVSSTLIRHEFGAFRKRSSNRKNLKTPGYRFRVDGKHFKKGVFRN